jgi:hypothetical protein
MRAIFALIVLTLATPAAAEEPSAPESPSIVRLEPSQAPASKWRTPCRDTIHQVREARGLPREAPTGPAQMIAAVDHRIDGCSVMVMYGNTSDVRPVPTTPGTARLERIPARQ